MPFSWARIVGTGAPSGAAVRMAAPRLVEIVPRLTERGAFKFIMQYCGKNNQIINKFGNIYVEKLIIQSHTEIVTYYLFIELLNILMNVWLMFLMWFAVRKRRDNRGPVAGAIRYWLRCRRASRGRL